MTVWAHHMFTTGAVLLPFFSFMTFLIAVPTGIKFFNWVGTMWRGQLTFEPAMLFAIGFLVSFLLGGLTGVILASPPLDFHVSDSYFMVAHFHYVLFGTVVFTMFAGFYFWWPKFTGKMLDNTLGKWHFWTLFIGFWMTFLVQHWLGVEGMPRRIANYPFLPGDVTVLNQISSIGSWILGASTFFFLYNVYKTWKYGEQVTRDDPWGYANSLEWATSCPPPRHNFTQHPADPVRAARLRPALPAHPDRPHPYTRPTREYPAAGVSIMASDAIEIRPSNVRQPAPEEPLPARNAGPGTAPARQASCSWERSKAIRWEMRKMFGKRYVDELISRSAENAADRLRFLKCASAAGLGLVGAGLLRWMATPALSAAAPDADAISDSAILNFALNLEYLEAEFYSYAVHGEGLPEDMTHGTGQRGPVDGGHEVQFGSQIDPPVRQRDRPR